MIALNAPVARYRWDYATLAGQLTLAVVLVGSWEWLARQYGHEWISMPSLIFERLLEWGPTELPHNIAVTLTEIVVGLLAGGSCGVALGLALGRAEILGTVLRPLIVALYSIPLSTMAPLLILWFGLDLTPKIVLVSVSSFFLLFFNTFSGVRAIDRNLITAMRLIGTNPGEEFRNVILPGAMVWILSGAKIAVPYAFAAAVTGELLAASAGIGSLIAKSAAQFDMTGIYTSLFVLMAMGIAANGVLTRIERGLLKWRFRTE